MICRTERKFWLAIAGILSLAAAHAEEEPKQLGFPADATVHHSIHLGGRLLKYEATVGSLPVRDEQGKAIATVMYISYVVPEHSRPVTFVLNGGPGASSAFLNLGALGPQHVQFGADGDSASAAAEPSDNAGTWIDFTDLVFIDPVGTGYSQSQLEAREARARFYNPKADVDYLSRVVFDWLVKNGRLSARKYLVGESYGGFRAPRMARLLQTRIGVGLSGMVLVSPYLDPGAFANDDLSPLPWIVTLPSIAAASLERQGKLTDAAMAEVIEYARGEYATDLLKGRSDPQGLERIVARVTALTGLDSGYVRRMGGRLQVQAYLREVFHNEGKLGSRYDSTVSTWDPFPFAPGQRTGDPILEGIVGPTTTAIVDFITRTVGWKYPGRYYALNYDVNEAWSDDDEKGEDNQRIVRGSVQELRQSLAADPKMTALIAHGWFDLDCPFMLSLLVLNQMPVMEGGAARVQVKEYEGGHMFYSREASRRAFREDARRMYSSR